MMNTPRPSILIVRPQARALADAAVCAQAGWTGLPFPPLHIEPLPVSGSLKRRFEEADAVFWVSPTAVETASCAGLFAGSLKNRPAHVAVGAATARALEAAGAQAVACDKGGNDSEAVLALPLWRALPPGATVLIAGGEGGRNWLSQQLQAAGLQTLKADLYRRVPQDLDWALFQAAAPAAAWITSVELVRALFGRTPANMAQALQSLLYFAHHERIRAALSDAGAVYVAHAQDIRAVLRQLDGRL